MDFTLRAPPILFGANKAQEAPTLIRRYGERVLVVTGGNSLQQTPFWGAFLQRAQEQRLIVEHYKISREPDTDLIDEGTRRCKESGCHSVIGLGGGSALDAAKVIAALTTNGGDALDYLEEIGRGKTIQTPPLPFFAIPTTAGSGSEVTKNSVIKIPEAKVKRSIRSDLMIPLCAIVDPTMCQDAPLHVAASAGLDALTHLIEAYVSRGAQPTTDALIVPGIKMACTALWALSRGDFAAHAEQMALASLWGGIALANAGLGVIHGLVAPLCGLKPIAHGTGCASLLPEGILANVAALKKRDPKHPALTRYQELAALINHGDRDIEAAALSLSTLRQSLGVPSLSVQGVSYKDFAMIIGGCRGGSMKSNPIALSDDELSELLTKSL
jgi:alcohol dehydrogenase class IV